MDPLSSWLAPASETRAGRPHREHSRQGKARRASRQLAALAAFAAAGVALTWPRAAYLAWRIPDTRDAAGYVWGFWWVARQVTHLSDPWVTSYQAAPFGAELAFHTLMPLPGLVMTPVTLAFGPALSYNLLSAVCPGLLAYAMWRAARLWLPGRAGPVAAGCLFGFSPELCWLSWNEINLALGAVFMPLALEAAVRLRRSRGPRHAVILGALLAAVTLTDQESAVMVGALTVAALSTWLLSARADWARRRLAALAAGVAALLASPQLLLMAEQAASGNATAAPHVLASYYNPSGTGLLQMVAPSPQLAHVGLTGLTWLFYQGRGKIALIGYGTSLTVLGLAGLAAAWRRRSARLLALLWLGGSVLALGSAPWIFNRDYHPLAIRFHGATLSGIMPYTWLVQAPGLSNFREADRFTELGLLAAALLAGAAVTWLAAHARPLLVVAAACALLEMGWSGQLATEPGAGSTMPASYPALVGPIAADHSHSIVVAVPFGIRGGVPVTGGAYPPQALVMATADGHPLADAYVSRIPAATLAAVNHDRFYTGLMRAQGGRGRNLPSQMPAARRDARRMHIGWVVVWKAHKSVLRYLRLTGFRFAYRADGARVYRRGHAVAAPGHMPPR